MHMKKGPSLKRFLFFAVALLSLGSMASSCKKNKVDPELCFESKVLPVFRSYCSTSGCHNAVDRKKGYDLTNYDGIMRGIRAGSVKSSKLLKAINNVDGVAMPPSSYPQPSAEQIETIEDWVNSGAVNTAGCGGEDCDANASAGFSATIQPLLATNCVGCHSGTNPNGGLDFSNFTVLQGAALDGSLVGAITGEPEFTAMPPNSRMATCDIALVEKWVAEGAQNN